MEIVLKRIAKQNTYTIGRMYILKDEEVERKVNYTLNKDQKRSFCHVVDVGKLDGEHYFCDTLEPTWRNLLGITLLPQEENVRLGRVSEKKAQKMKGKTQLHTQKVAPARLQCITEIRVRIQLLRRHLAHCLQPPALVHTLNRALLHILILQDVKATYRVGLLLRYTF